MAITYVEKNTKSEKFLLYTAQDVGISYLHHYVPTGVKLDNYHI